MKGREFIMLRLCFLWVGGGGGVPSESKVPVGVYPSLSGGRGVTPVSFLSCSAIPEGIGGP